MKIKKRDWITFDELSSTDRRFRVLNLTIMVLMCIVSISFLIVCLTNGDPNNRILATCGVLFITLLPFILELIFKIRINNLLFFLYLLYFFFAGILGSVFNFYNISALNLNHWYDVFIHFLAGYSFCFLGLFVLARIEQYNKLNLWTIVLFAFAFTLACELMWELFERFADMFLGQTAQGIKVDGYSSPLLADTMTDIFCNFLGGLVFVAHYMLGKRSKLSLGVDFIENEIAYKGTLNANKAQYLKEKTEKEKYKVDILIAKDKEESTFEENFFNDKF